MFVLTWREVLYFRSCTIFLVLRFFIGAFSSISSDVTTPLQVIPAFRGAGCDKRDMRMTRRHHWRARAPQTNLWHMWQYVLVTQEGVGLGGWKQGGWKHVCVQAMRLPGTEQQSGGGRGGGHGCGHGGVQQSGSGRAGGMPTCSHKYKAADSGAGCSCRTPPVSCRRTGRRSACSPCACRRPCRRSGASSTDRSCSTRRTASPGTSDSYTRRSVGSAHTSGRSGGSWSSGQPLSSPPTLLSSAPWLTSEVTHIGVKLLQRIILRLLTVCLNIWKPSPQVYQYNVF